MEKDSQNKIYTIITFIVVVIVVITGIQLVDIGIDLIRRQLQLDIPSEEQIEIIVETINAPPEPTDLLFYNDMKKVNLIKSVNSGVDPDGEIFGRTFERIIKSDGEISNGYLYVKISVDHGMPMKVWDSVYISIRKVVDDYKYKPTDGHLLRRESLVLQDHKNNTTLLYDLNQIPLISIPYSENKTPTYNNWLDLIENTEIFQFETFLSTSRVGGVIEEISIGYQCAEKTPDCTMEVLDW